MSRLSLEWLLKLLEAAIWSLRLLVEVFLYRVEFLNEAVVSVDMWGTRRFVDRLSESNSGMGRNSDGEMRLLFLMRSTSAVSDQMLPLPADSLKRVVRMRGFVDARVMWVLWNEPRGVKWSSAPVEECWPSGKGTRSIDSDYQ